MASSTKVQVYLGAANVEDIQMCVEAGADLLGLVADQRIIGNESVGGHVLPSLSQVKALFASVPLTVTTVALSFARPLGDVRAALQAVMPRAVHLAGNEMLSVQDLRCLRSEFPSVKVMQAIAVNRPDSIRLALEYQSVCDFFLLDSKGEESEHPYGVGATGVPHDWTLSARLVRAVNIPVILAGGLHAGNVRDAIHLVEPWGVDSFTLTNLAPDRESRKDPTKVREFIAAAKHSRSAAS